MINARAILRKFVIFVIAAWITVLCGMMLALFATIISPKHASAANDYGPALQNAERAALIQTGAQSFLDRLQTYGEEQGRKLVYTLVDPKYLNPTVAICYVTYRQRFDTGEFPSPIIPAAKHSLSLTPTDGSLSTIWRF